LVLIKTTMQVMLRSTQSYLNSYIIVEVLISYKMVKMY